MECEATLSLSLFEKFVFVDDFYENRFDTKTRTLWSQIYVHACRDYDEYSKKENYQQSLLSFVEH